jgi:putative transposase
MPRAARLVVPEVALHLVQRCHNRMPCFFGAGDYADYLQYLARFAAQFGCAIHAYCLMTNHVHLLLTPRERNGWSGRFRSCLVATTSYALTCYRYIELNPVRAGIVAQPRDYRWSSYHANAEGSADPVLSAHAAYLALAQAPEDRIRAYRALFDSSLEAVMVEEIRKATRGGYLAGSRRRPRGRPPRGETENNRSSPSAGNLGIVPTLHRK